MKVKQVVLTILLVGILCASASADSVYAPCTASATPPCSFNMSGIITVTGTTITWESDQPGNTPNTFTLTGGQNVFSVIPSGSQETILSLNLASEPVGTVFGPFPFIEFPNPPGNGLPGLNIDFIFAGIYSTATCGGTPAVGQQCTPAIAGGGPGPFNFVNNPPAAPQGPEATATFVFAGVTADGAGTWQANFTSQFFVPFQTVLSTLASAGSVQNSYSATTKVTVTVAPIPEPGTLALLMGTVLMLASVGLRRHIARSQRE